MSYFVRIIEALWTPPSSATCTAAKPKELSEREKTRVSEVEKKSTKLGYRVKILGLTIEEARQVFHQVGMPWMLDGKMLRGATGTPMRMMALANNSLADAEPEPLTLANLMTKSLLLSMEFTWLMSSGPPFLLRRIA